MANMIKLITFIPFPLKFICHYLPILSRKNFKNIFCYHGLVLSLACRRNMDENTMWAEKRHSFAKAWGIMV